MGGHAGRPCRPPGGRLTSYTVTTPTYEAPRPTRAAEPARPRLRASHDAAQTTPDNRNHWLPADGLSPVAAASERVRNVLRRRSQYETDNNCYAKGVVGSNTSDCVGKGPRLQVQTPDRELNAAIEDEWKRWADATNLPCDLRVLDLSRRVRGESFGLFVTTDRYRRQTPVQLALRLFEADQVATPLGGRQPANLIDGVYVGADGRPDAYSLLRHHPGDTGGFAAWGEADRVPADRMIHWLIPDRPGQLRQVPELTPALPLFALLRRYGLATVHAAEFAASISGVLTTDLPPGVDGAEPEPLDEVAIVRNKLLTLLAGQKVEQFDPAQPTSNHEQFVRAVLREVGRASDTPYGIMAGDCSGYNYSSARLDFQTNDLRRGFERDQFRLRVMVPLLYEWLSEARFAVPLIAARLPDPFRLPHTWHFDARPSIDPVKDATADEMDLANGTTSLAAICAADGTDWEEVAVQRQKEAERLRELGLPVPWERDASPAAQTSAAASREGAVLND